MPTEMMASWGTLVMLGAFHGINPGMGWLFAVALGMQERRRGAVWRALVPLGAGHALAIAVAVGVALALGLVIPLASLRWPIAAVLVSLGVLRFYRHRHPRWTGMRVSMGGLTVWSFLMATAHGAGLMLWPALMAICYPAGAEPGDAGALAPAALGIGVHTLAMLAVTGAVAVGVYEWIGLGILRRAWFNLDLVWTIALVAAGALLLLG